MARVEIRPSGGRQYVVVVDDVQDARGQWKKRVIRSFGNVDNPLNLEKAQHFAAAINAGKSIREANQEVGRDELAALLETVLAAGAVGLALAWLFSEK